VTRGFFVSLLVTLLNLSLQVLDLNQWA